MRIELIAFMLLRIPALAWRGRLRLGRISSFRHYAAKRIITSTENDWETINFGNEKEAKKQDMADRIKNAELWESQQFSDEEFAKINKMLGIDKELEDLELEGEESLKPTKSKKELADKSKIRKLPGLEKDERSQLKGFLELNPFMCSGCGTPFQSKATDEPGFLPKEKFQAHRRNADNIREQQEAIKILDMASIDISSPAAYEILREADISQETIEGIRNLGKAFTAAPRRSPGAGYPTSDEATPETSLDTIQVCQRCFRLQQYGKIEEGLRPGWSNHELLTPERFEALLSSIKETKTVVACIVDIFDLKGSILRNLKTIAGDNPVVIAVNKIDLLPSDLSNVRVINWIYSEIQAICDMQSPRAVESERRARGPDDRPSYKAKDESEFGILRRQNIHLVSCNSGEGMDKLISDLMVIAMDNGAKVHIMGAANVGKSSFINRLIGDNGKVNRGKGSRAPHQRAKGEAPKVTVSNLPGTTLDFLKIKLPNGVTMVDTPGLLNQAQLTARLTTEELKKVIPAKPINAVTLRVSEGKCVMIGGLAVVELKLVS